MNKWFRRAVGTVGVAGGMLLLGAGTAHAEDVVPTTGALDDLISPAGDLAALNGPDNLGVTLDTPGSRWSAGAVDDGPVAFGPNTGEVGATLHTPDEHGQARDVFAGGRLPDLIRSLPATGPALPANAQKLLGSLPLGNLPLGGLPNATSGDGLVPAGGASRALPAQQTNALPAQQTEALPAQQTEGLPALPSLNGLPLVSGHLPALTGQGRPSLDAASVSGVLHPVDDVAVPLGSRHTEAAVPVLGDVLEDNTIDGLPSLPELFNSYLPKHAADDETEALPAIGGLSGLPLIGNLLAGGAGLLGN